MVVLAEYELITFFASIVLAFLLGVIYDFFRAIRVCIKKTLVPDILMWISVFVIVGTVWFFVQNGEIRWYMILGTFLSGIIYFILLSKYVFFVVAFLVDKICLIFRIIFKILLTPLGFLCKMISVYVIKAKSKFSKKVEEKYDEKKA